AFRLQAQHRERITFSPTSFSNAFSANKPPALKIRPGDTVCTETIDAMGYDQKGVRRARGGNPLTGPFIVEGAMPGDVLAIRLDEVSLNRDFAYTTEYFGSRSMPKEVMRQMKRSRLVKWKLYLEKNQGRPDTSNHDYPHL